MTLDEIEVQSMNASSTLTDIIEDVEAGLGSMVEFSRDPQPASLYGNPSTRGQSSMADEERSEQKQVPKKQTVEKSDRSVEQRTFPARRRFANEKPTSRFPDRGKASTPEGQEEN